LISGASASRGVHVYAPAFADTKLCCLVNGDRGTCGCEHLAQSRYAAAPWTWLELATVGRKFYALPSRQHASLIETPCWKSNPLFSVAVPGGGGVRPTELTETAKKATK